MSTGGVDLGDPRILLACKEMLADMLRWVLLGYTNKPYQLYVFASGKGDVNQMKEYVKADDICYGVFSEPGRDCKSFRLTVTYIPDAVGGVWRARALVHGKAVANQFLSEKMIRVADTNHFNVQRFRSGLELPPRVTDYVPASSAVNVFSPPLSPVASPPPRADSLKTRQLMSRKPVPSSNRPYPYPPHDTKTANTFRLGPAESLTSLISNPSNATQLSLFSIATGTAAVENFRLRSESPLPSPCVKASNCLLSLPSPPEDRDDGDDTDDASVHQRPASLLTDSSGSSGSIDPAQSPRQRCSTGLSQASPQEHGSQEKLSDETLEKEDDMEDMPDSYSIADFPPMAKSLPTETKPPTLFRDKPLPPVRYLSVDVLEGIQGVSPSSPIEKLPVNTEPQRKPTGDSARAVTISSLSSLPSPPSSPEDIKTQLPVPSPSVLSLCEGIAQHTPLSQSYSQPPPSPPLPPLAKMQVQNKGLPFATPLIQPQVTRQIPYYLQPQPQSQSQPQSQPQPRPPLHLQAISPAQNSSSSSDTPVSSSYNAFRINKPSAMKHLNHRRISTAIDEAEEEKIAALIEEGRRRAMELATRDKKERREQEARDREFMERREQTRLRRLQNVKITEMMRAELRQKQECEEARRQAQEERRHEEKLRRQMKIQEKIKNLEGMLLLAGFISVLSGTTWRRRYYQLTTDKWKFFKNDEDTRSPLSILALSRIKAVREWNEGYEELEFMSNSFAVELNDGVPWLFFAESKEEKEMFSGLLGQARGK